MCHCGLKSFFYLYENVSSGIEIDGSTVGVAFLGTMCFYDDSVGFTQVRMNVTTITMQQELSYIPYYITILYYGTEKHTALTIITTRTKCIRCTFI